MNKLDVAFKLLRLLNERKDIDSKVVANELNVSIRTAQRYLMELSAMPCVSNGHNNRSYTLNGDYELKKAIMNQGEADNLGEFNREDIPLTSLNETICVICASQNKSLKESFWGPGERPVSNKQKIDKLTAMISKNLKINRCSFR